MRILAIGILLSATCSGGGQGQQVGGPGTPGDDHVVDTDDRPPGDGGAASMLPDGDGGAAAVPAGPQAAFTAEIKNSGTTDLELNIDKGWGLVLSGWSGQPPKAKPILMFPSYCTAACDAAEADRCPKCVAPEDSRDQKLAEQRLVIPPGKSHVIEWDTQVHVYQKVEGKKRCDCYTTAPVPPETYTLRACGFRITKSAGERTKQQCFMQQVTLPPDKPTRIVFDFPQPPAK